MTYDGNGESPRTMSPLCAARTSARRRRPFNNGEKTTVSKWTQIPAAGRPRNFSLRRSRVSISKLFVNELIHMYISRAARRYPGRIVRRDYSSLPPPPPPRKRGTALVHTIIYLFFFFI